MTNSISNILNSCTLCPRKCKVNRNIGEKGFCGVGAKLVVAKASLHMWEEPCISGENGSGTIFFSGCNLKCVYCQNANISKNEVGKEITPKRLCEIFFELAEKGANNINLVTPTHYIVSIVEAIEIAKKQGFRLPIVYNCGGYEDANTLKYLDGLIDIYLTDFKYFKAETARKYSNAFNYPEVARSGLEEMVGQQSKPEFNEKQVMKKGVIVRQLLLPAHVTEAKNITEYLFNKYKDSIYISFMNQYTPIKKFVEYPELNRRVTKREYNSWLDFAIKIGVKNGFVQEWGTAKESFIPQFDCSGV